MEQASHILDRLLASELVRGKLVLGRMVRGMLVLGRMVLGTQVLGRMVRDTRGESEAVSGRPNMKDTGMVGAGTDGKAD